MTALAADTLAFLEDQAVAADMPGEGQGGRVAAVLAQLVAHRVFEQRPETVRGYPVLEGYVNAARALAVYYGSAERAAYIQPLDAPPIVGGPVSLEWFRRQVPAPPGVLPLSWLGFCEWVLRTSEIRPDSPGELYSRIQGRTYHLRFRREDGMHPALTWAEPLSITNRGTY